MDNIVAIDVGLKRIGVAKSILGVSMPSDPIFRKNREQASKDVSKILKDTQAKILVVGIPDDLVMQKRIKHFVSLIDFDGKIVFVDESFSSKEANKIVKDKRDGKLDSISAKIILDRYLNI